MVPVAPDRQAHQVSIYGRISHHLIVARETALAHDCQSTFERLTVEALVVQIDLLIIAARRLHHDDRTR